MADSVAATALGPANDGKELDAALGKPGALLTGSETDIGLRPFTRPVVFRTIEGGGAQPVLQGKVVGVANAHAPLLGRVDQEQPAERPERLAAERLLRFLVENEDFPARLGELGRGDQPREASADDDDIRVVSQCFPPFCVVYPRLVPPAGATPLSDRFPAILVAGAEDRVDGLLVQH